MSRRAWIAAAVVLIALAAGARLGGGGKRQAQPVGPPSSATAPASAPAPNPAPAPVSPAPQSPALPAVITGVHSATLPPERPVVRGRVLDPEGTPLARVRVGGQGLVILEEGKEATPYGGVFETRTDEEGRFAVAADPGLLRLSVNVAPWALTTKDAVVPGEEVSFQLDRGQIVSGRIVFPGGAPVPGLEVRDGDTGRTATTDVEGRFALAGLRGRSVILRVPLSPRSWNMIEWSPSMDGDAYVLDRHLLRIRMEDEKGQELPHAEVVVQAMGDTSTADYRAGGLIFSCFSEDGAEVTGHAPGRDSQTAAVRSEGPARFHDVRLVLPSLGERSSLRLQVVDGGARPLRKVLLTIHRQDGWAIHGFRDQVFEPDEEGRVLVTGIPVDARRLEVIPAEETGDPSDFRMPGTAAWTPVAGKESSLRVVLPTGGRIRVTVRGPGGEVLLAEGVRVLTAESEVEGTYFQFPEAEDGSGRTKGPALLWNLLPPGRYVLALMKNVHEIPVRAGNTDDFRAHAAVEVLPGAIADVELRLPDEEE